MPVARTPPQGGPHSPYSPPTPTLNDQAGRHAKSDNPDDIKVPKFSVGESVGRDSFDARFIRGQVSMGQRSVFEQAPLSGPFTPPATAQQDRTCHLISAATFLNYILQEFLPDSLERSQHKRKANIDKSVDITAGDDTSLRQVRPSSIALLKDMLLKEAMSKEFVPVDVSVESPKSQSWSEVIRGPMPYAVRRDESFEHNRPAFPRQIVDMASFSTDTSFDNIPPSPFTSLSNARVLHHRPSSGMQLLRSATSLWTFIIILASIFPTAQASPLTYAEGSLSTVSGTPIGLYVACAIPVAVGIIGYIMTLFYKLFGPSWRNCLGVLSLMASIVWTCLVHWDKAPDLRKFVLALCHGLISNFTLQLCMSRRRKLLPEAWAINLGFPLAALLLRFLDALPIVAPNGEEMPALPSSITDLIWSGFLRWATSPLQFTSWAILVKVAFYTCDVIINRHDPQPPTTLWGRFVKRIACSAEELPGRFLRINQEGRANQGAAIANGHHAGVPDNGVELNNLFPDMNPAQTAVE